MALKEPYFLKVPMWGLKVPDTIWRTEWEKPKDDSLKRLLPEKQL